MAAAMKKAFSFRPLVQALFSLGRQQQNRQIISADRATIYNLFSNVSGQPNLPESLLSRQIVSKKVQVNSVPLHYAITGTGKNVILLLPGALGCARTDFIHQLEGMNKDLFTVVALDPRGYGLSIPPERDWPDNYLLQDAEDAAQFMTNLGFDKYSVLGWSDGGISALMMAARFPHQVHKLVVWGTNAYITDEDMKAYETYRNIDNWSEEMRTSFLAMYSEEYLRKHVRCWLDAVSVYMKKYGGDICRSDLEKIRCPTMVFHGEKDSLLPRSHPEFLVEKIKNSW
jgi:valacyclovir hydrolase